MSDKTELARLRAKLLKLEKEVDEVGPGGGVSASDVTGAIADFPTRAEVTGSGLGGGITALEVSGAVTGAISNFPTRTETSGAITSSLTNYARLDQQNIFTAPQIISGSLTTTGSITAVTGNFTGPLILSGSSEGTAIAMPVNTRLYLSPYAAGIASGIWTDSAARMYILVNGSSAFIFDSTSTAGGPGILLNADNYYNLGGNSRWKTLNTYNVSAIGTASVGNLSASSGAGITGSLIQSGSLISLSGSARSGVTITNNNFDLVVTGSNISGAQLLLDVTNNSGSSQLIGQASNFVVMQAGTSSFPYYFQADADEKFVALESDDHSGSIYIGATGYNSSVIIGSNGYRNIVIGSATASTTTISGSLILDAQGSTPVVYGNFNVTGTISGAYIVGDGSGLDGISGTITTGSQTFYGAKRSAVTALSSSGSSIAIDLSLNNNFSHTFTEDTTLAAPTNAAEGQSGIITFTQHSSSVKTLSFNSFWKFPGGTPSTASTPITSAIDALAYYTPSASYAICQMLNDIKT